MFETCIEITKDIFYTFFGKYFEFFVAWFKRPFKSASGARDDHPEKLVVIIVIIIYP